MVFFVSAYANDVTVSLPTIPLLPWPIIRGAFFGASGLIALAMVAVTYGKRRSSPMLTY